MTKYEFYKEPFDISTKERFLDTIDISQYPPRWWERIFEKSEIFETRKEKDLYSFTVPDIIEFYKFLNCGTITPLIIYNTNLLKYGQWALNETLISDGLNHFDEIDTEILATCISKLKSQSLVLSYQDFKEMIFKIPNDIDKYVFYCLFEGIKGADYEDIVKLKLSDIDENEQIVHLDSGRTVPVSKEFIQICKNANAQVVYTGLSVNQLERDLIPSIYIFKEKSNSSGKDINRTVYNTIVRNIKDLRGENGSLTARSIKDSGLIYYLNKRAEELKMNAEDLLYSTDKCMDIIYKYNFNLMTRKRWILQYKDFLI